MRIFNEMQIALNFCCRWCFAAAVRGFSVSGVATKLQSFSYVTRSSLCTANTHGRGGEENGEVALLCI